MIKLRLPFKKKPEGRPSSVIGLRRLNAPKKHYISKRKIALILAVFLLIFLGLGIFLMIKNNPLQIKKIEFKNADLSCVSNEQLKNFLNLTSLNYFNLNPKLLEQKTKEKFSCISSIGFSQKFPSAVEIEAHDRKLAAVIKVFQLPNLQLDLEEATSSSQEAKIVDNTAGAIASGEFIVDEEGIILKVQDNTSDLPVIDYYNQDSELKLGSKIPDDLIGKSLTVINLLNQQALSFKQTKIVNKGLFLTGDQELIFSLSKDLNRQLAALQLILHQATINSKEVKKVDLRFDKTIVVYSAQK